MKRLALTVALLSLIIVATPLSSWSQARESLGTVSVSDILVESTYVHAEPGQGSFGLANSYLAAAWRRDTQLSAQIKIGSTRLIRRPVYYGPETAELGLIEGYAELDGDYGRLRLGLVPIPFGLEGGAVESRLRFPRSLLYETRLINLRDYGFSYRITSNGFFSEWTIHNGEGGPDLDNEAWLAARWGWQGTQFVRLGLSGLAGRTSPRSTNRSGSGSGSGTANPAEVGLVDVNRAARVRIANAFLDAEVAPFRASVEASAGDTRQDNDVLKMRALHVDLELEATPNVSWLARYDTVDPRSDARGDQIAEATLGLAWKSRYENSVFYVLGTKRFQEDVQPDRHRVLLLWRMTPEALSFKSSL